MPTDVVVTTSVTELVNSNFGPRSIWDFVRDQGLLRLSLIAGSANITRLNELLDLTSHARPVNAFSCSRQIADATILESLISLP